MEVKDGHLYSHQKYADLRCLSGEEKLEDRHYGLAEYIDEDSPLYKLVNVIDYYVGDEHLIFRCTGDISEEDEESIQLLKEEIEGQISDGAWENGIYLLECMIGDKVKHYWVEDEIEQVVIHPFEHSFDSMDEYVFIPGNHKTVKTLIDEWCKKKFVPERNKYSKVDDLNYYYAVLFELLGYEVKPTFTDRTAHGIRASYHMEETKKETENILNANHVPFHWDRGGHQLVIDTGYVDKLYKED